MNTSLSVSHHRVRTGLLLGLSLNITMAQAQTVDPVNLINTLTGGGGIQSLISMVGGGQIGSMLSSLMGGGTGGLMSLVSMIPGLNFLAGVGPIMNMISSIPGVGSLLSSIPGLGSVLSMFGFGGQSADLTPLTQQLGNVGKWITTATNLFKSAQGIAKDQNYNDMTNSVNDLLRMAGVKETSVSAQEFKGDPQVAAKTAINALNRKQQFILGHLSEHEGASRIAVKTQLAEIEDSKARAQRTADNATALQGTIEVAKQADARTKDSLEYTTTAGNALKTNTKTEDITKIVGSTNLEIIRQLANSSAAMTTAVANQLKVQVATADSLNQMVNMMQQDRLDKARAVSDAIDRQNAAYEASMRSQTQQASNIGDGFRGMFKVAKPLGGD